MLNKELDNLIKILNNMGIVTKKLELQFNHIFILDTINEKIIIPSNNKIKLLSK